MNTTNQDPSARPALEIATLGGGCFWCLEAVYQEVDGVEDVVSGYAGGEGDEPTYREVCGGQTGHAEVVQLTFDPGKVPYRRLLEIFFVVHDPTTLNRQGADVGTQYRSVIFTHSSEQRQTAEALIEEFEAEGLWDQPVVTEITDLDPESEFFVAEEDHQNYYRRNPYQGYCQMVVAPKLAKYRRAFLPGGH